VAAASWSQPIGRSGNWRVNCRRSCEGAFAVAGGAVEGGQPQQGAFGGGLALQELLDGAQGLLGLALEHEGGGHAQDEAFVGRVELGGLAVGVVGEIVLIGELVVDAERVEGVGLCRPLTVRGQGGGRNKPSIQQGRRAGQRPAAGRDAEEDEAERKTTRRVPRMARLPAISSCDGPRADACGVCAWPS
jgi:hypothetical protein